MCTVPGWRGDTCRRLVQDVSVQLHVRRICEKNDKGMNKNWVFLLRKTSSIVVQVSHRTKSCISCLENRYPQIDRERACFGGYTKPSTKEVGNVLIKYNCLKEIQIWQKIKRKWVMQALCWTSYYTKCWGMRAWQMQFSVRGFVLAKWSVAACGRFVRTEKMFNFTGSLLTR